MYLADLFNGAAQLAGPLAKVIFEKLGNETERQLVGALNALQGGLSAES
jgi:hypothetical protein